MVRLKNVVPLVKEISPSKSCRVCGREIPYSRRAAPEWSRIEYCSAGCRRTGVANGRLATEALADELTA